MHAASVAAAGDIARCVDVARLDPDTAVTIDPGRISGTSTRRAPTPAATVRVEVLVTGPLGVDLRGHVHAELIAESGSGPPVGLIDAGRPGVFAANVPPGHYRLVVQSVDAGGARPLGLVTPPRRALLDQKVNKIAVQLAPPGQLFYRIGNSLVPFAAPERVAMIGPGLSPLGPHLTIEQLDNLAKRRDGSLDRTFLGKAPPIAIVFEPLAGSRARAGLIADLRRLERSGSVRIGGALLDAQRRVTLIDSRFNFRFAHGPVRQGRTRLLELFGLRVIKESVDDADVAVVEFRKDDLSANLATVNCLVEQGLLITGEPDLVVPWVPSDVPPDGWPNDPGYTARGRTNLQNQGVDKAWALLYDAQRGLVGKSSVNVGILDWQVDPEDAELKCVVDGEPQLALCWNPARFNTTGDGSCIASSAEAATRHGSAMLGVIAACTNNFVGVAGVAPGVRLRALGFRLDYDYDYFSQDDYADKLRWMAGLVTPCGRDRSQPPLDPCHWPAARSDVLNNSYQMALPPGWNLAAPIELPDKIATVFQRLVSEGRQVNGTALGTVLVFAAGNWGITDPRLIIGMPTNVINPLAADERTIAVSNCMLDGAQEQLYRHLSPGLPSNYGDRIDLCADGEGTLPIPSVCASISPCPLIGGTSSAAATVTGVVALMLSANPNLSWNEVRRILRDTADKIDCGQTDPEGMWVDGESKWYGAGRLNAADAVMAATNGTGPAKSCPAPAPP